MIEKYSTEYNKITKLVSLEIKKKLKYTRPTPFSEYFSLNHDKSTLDGEFTSEELRLIAEGMDAVRAVINGSKYLIRIK